MIIKSVRHIYNSINPTHLKQNPWFASAKDTAWWDARLNQSSSPWILSLNRHSSESILSPPLLISFIPPLIFTSTCQSAISDSTSEPIVRFFTSVSLSLSLSLSYHLSPTLKSLIFSRAWSLDPPKLTSYLHPLIANCSDVFSHLVAHFLVQPVFYGRVFSVMLQKSALVTPLLTKWSRHQQPF